MSHFPNEGRWHCVTYKSDVLPSDFYLGCTWTCKSRAWLHILEIRFGEWKVGWCRKRSHEEGIKMRSSVPLWNDWLLWMLILYLFFPLSFSPSSALFFPSSWCCSQGNSTPSPVLWPFSSCWCMLPWTWPAWLWNGHLHQISGTHMYTHTHTHTHTLYPSQWRPMGNTCDVTFCSTLSSLNTLLLPLYFLPLPLFMCVFIRRWLFASWMLPWWQCTN